MTKLRGRFRACDMLAVETRNLMISLLLFSDENQTRYPRKESSRQDLGTAVFLVGVMLFGR